MKTYVAEFAEYWLPIKRTISPSSKQGDTYIVEDYATFVKITMTQKYKRSGVQFTRDVSAIINWMYKSSPDWVVVMLKEIEREWKTERQEQSYSDGAYTPSTKDQRQSTLYPGRNRW